MGNWVRIQEGLPVEVISEDPTGKFHESIKWIALPDHFVSFLNAEYIVVEVGSGKSKTEAVVPPTIDYYHKQLAASIAAYRWDRQIAGVTINDVSHRTDKETLTDLNSKIVDGMLYEQTNGEGSFITNWKAANGFYDLNLEELKEIKQKCTEYVDACFETNKMISEAVYNELATTNDFGKGYEKLVTLLEDTTIWPDRIIIV